MATSLRVKGRWVRVEAGSIADVANRDESLQAIVKCCTGDVIPEEVFLHPVLAQLIAMRSSLSLDQVEELNAEDRCTLIGGIGDALAAHLNL